MIRHGLLLIIMSVLVVLFLDQISHFLHLVGSIHNQLSDHLSRIFAVDETGQIITHVLALLLIPVGFALVPAAGYFLLKREAMPYTIQLAWIAWIILATYLGLHSELLTSVPAANVV